MKSVMSHNFSQIPNVNIPRSMFDRSHGYKTTFNADALIPIFVDEVLPGDTFKMNPTLFARLATPIAPFMDNLFLDTFFFFVPNRLLWDNWERFNGAQDDPGDSTDYEIPQVVADADGFAEYSIFDYMGIPIDVPNLSVNALPIRAYNLIYNEWFRDQNIQDSLDVATDDGPDAEADYSLKLRNKKHDYFTSCLPWPQKGDSVEIGIGATAPVIGDGIAMGLIGKRQFETGDYEFGLGDDSGLLAADLNAAGVDVGTTFVQDETPQTLTAVGLSEDTTKSHVFADLSSATAITINSLRQSFQIQKMLEKDARSGTRYIEVIKGHFGVTNPDYRLQRPEYLSGGSSRININPVAQTSGSPATPGIEEDTPQGNLAAFGVGTSKTGSFSKSFTEHGYIIGLVNVRADLTYQQGLNKLWMRETRYDFYWPSFAHLGEQAVTKKELYTQGTANDDLVFGYQERYAEYRYKPSLITGAFRSAAATPLDFWHLSQEFDSEPSLNENFIRSDTPIERVIAVTTEPQFLLDVWYDFHCARPMPVYSVPGLIDHF